LNVVDGVSMVSCTSKKVNTMRVEKNVTREMIY
jgi:hypothetical protein